MTIDRNRVAADARRATAGDRPPPRAARYLAISNQYPWAPLKHLAATYNNNNTVKTVDKLLPIFGGMQSSWKRNGNAVPCPCPCHHCFWILLVGFELLLPAGDGWGAALEKRLAFSVSHAINLALELNMCSCVWSDYWTRKTLTILGWWTWTLRSIPSIVELVHYVLSTLYWYINAFYVVRILRFRKVYEKGNHNCHVGPHLHAGPRHQEGWG